METIKVLLDTDIGTDIDDAVCLAYLLSQPKCELLGITTVTGEAEKRAMLASALCKHAGWDIPIYPGMEEPILLPLRQSRAQQAERLTAWEHETVFPKGEAIEFLRRTIRQYPGEVVLLTIAPLTNIALLFSVDPEIPRLLKGMVSMCGRFLDPVPAGYEPIEWNARCDAHATSIVYRAPLARHRSIGLDVTSQVAMMADEFRRVFAEFPIFAPVLDFAEVWFRDWPGTTFHDPLAASVIFDESICRFEKGTVRVPLAEGESQGVTLWMRGVEKGGRHEIATAVDPQKYFTHLLQTLKGPRA